MDLKPSSRLRQSFLSPSTTESYTLSSPEERVSTRSLSKLSFLTRRFGAYTFRSRNTSAVLAAEPQSTVETAKHGKGPYGLVTVSQPDNADQTNAHIIFVHGLGGGSEHTWTKDGIFWPRDLLPAQEPFQDAGIHTFGYDSNFKKTSTLNINDFSKALLNSIINSPCIGASTVCVYLYSMVGNSTVPNYGKHKH